MTQWITLLSVCVVLAFAVAVACGCIAYLVDVVATFLRNQSNKRDERIRELAIRDLGKRIVCGYHWFSEDDSAFALVKIIGESLQRGDYWNEDRIRDKWRREMKKDQSAK